MLITIIRNIRILGSVVNRPLSVGVPATIVAQGKESLRQRLCYGVLCSLAAAFLLSLTALPTSAAAIGKVIVSGDEWTLTNTAFTNNPTSTTNFATNVANFIGGANYLFLGEGDFVNPYGSSLESLYTNAPLNRTVVRDSSLPPSLAPYEAVFLAGEIGSGSDNVVFLKDYVRNGGAVYLSLATGNFGTAEAEAEAWNPFLNEWGLSAGDTWFPEPGVRQISTILGGHPLEANVSQLAWGYGQEITADPNRLLTQIAIEGEFVDLGNRGMVGVATTPVPAALPLFGTALVGFGFAAWRRRKAN